MKKLKNGLFFIVGSGLLLYLIATYVPQLGLTITSEYKEVYIIFLFLGIVFWLVHSVLKTILKIVTLPVHALTLGLSSLLLNVLLFYVFEQLVNSLELGVKVALGTIIQVFVLSCVMSVFGFLLKHK